MSQVELHDVLIQEAAFQDKRVISKKEPRDAFSYLYQRALDWYWNTLTTISSGKRVLVVGCSEHTVIPLAKISSYVVGIDISPAAIANLSSTIEKEGLTQKAKAFVMNAEEPDFPSGSFDVICCSGVLHHLDSRKSLENWHKLLTPGGVLLMMEPMKYNLFAAAYRIVTPSQRTHNEHPLTFYDLQIIRELYQDVRFQTNSLFTPISLIGHYIHCQPIKNVLFSILEMLDDVIFRLFPFSKVLAWSMVINCVKKK
jgi:SAM-dependent methyltransferase